MKLTRQTKIDRIVRQIQLHLEQGDRQRALVLLRDADLEDPPTNDPFEINMIDAGVHEYSANILEREGSKFVADLKNHSLASLMARPNIGPVRTRDIASIAARYGVEMVAAFPKENFSWMDRCRAEALREEIWGELVP